MGRCMWYPDVQVSLGHKQLVFYQHASLGED